MAGVVFSQKIDFYARKNSLTVITKLYLVLAVKGNRSRAIDNR